MQAYCILAGGGVKAACFGGALQAAADNNVEFLGYGGTSAGALVATLAAVGYSGEEIHEIFAELQMAKLLPDEGALITDVSERAAGVAKSLASGTKFGMAWGLYSEWKLARPLIHRFSSDLGLYHPDILRNRLRELINDRLGTTYDEITFDDLRQNGCAPLRIVASDVRRHRAVLFGTGERGFGASVLTAAVASAAFPGVFQPLEIGDTYLLDGGLSSNLPAFLFGEDALANLAPTIAIDLVETEVSSAAYEAKHLAGDLVSTTLSASDDLLLRADRNLIYLPIEVPPSLSTFKLSLNEGDLKAAQQSGYSGAAKGIAASKPFQIAWKAGEDLSRQLRAKYASKELIQPVLFGAILHLRTLNKGADLRLSVMVPTGRGTRKVIYHLGMDGHADADLELPEGAGCTGLAFTTGSPILADLEDAALHPEKWGMTADDVAKIPSGRKSMFAVPIRSWGTGTGRDANEAKESPIVATLAIDSTTSLETTGWKTSDREVDGEFLEALLRWAEVLAKLFA